MSRVTVNAVHQGIIAVLSKFIQNYTLFLRGVDALAVQCCNCTQESYLLDKF